MRRKTRQGADEDLDMVPIMNMFLVIVPFLLMSASFIHIKAINASVPIMGELSKSEITEKKMVKVTVIAEIMPDGILLSLNSDALGPQDMKKWTEKITPDDKQEYEYSSLKDYLRKLKTEYPASDTLIIIPAGDVVYDTIIKIMDVARQSEDKINLFPNVVISGKVT